MLVKVEELTADLSRVRLFHTSVSRAIATLADLARRAAASPATSPSTSPRRSRPRPRPTSRSSRPASTSEETYVEQGLYWATGHLPMLEYVAQDLQAGPAAGRHARPPTSSSTSSSASCSPTLPNGSAEPGLRRRRPRTASRDGRVAAREGYIRTAYEEADETLDARPQPRRRATRRRSSRPTTASRRSSSRSTPASRWSTSELPVASPRPSNCRPGGRTSTIGKAKACWAGGAAPDLPERRGRDPAAPAAHADPGGRRRRDRSPTIKATYLGLDDPNDWTHDGQPEGWKMIDRVFTKAEARYIPNGPAATADMAHPTRTGDVVVVRLPAVPVRRRDARHAGRAVALLRPARLRAGRPGPRRQHQHAGDLPRRRQRASPRARSRPLDRPRADARVHARHPRAAAQPGPGPARDRQGRRTSIKPISIVGLNDFHGQLDPTTVDRRRP